MRCPGGDVKIVAKHEINKLQQVHTSVKDVRQDDEMAGEVFATKCYRSSPSRERRALCRRLRKSPRQQSATAPIHPPGNGTGRRLALHQRVGLAKRTHGKHQCPRLFHSHKLTPEPATPEGKRDGATRIGEVRAVLCPTDGVTKTFVTTQMASQKVTNIIVNIC